MSMGNASFKKDSRRIHVQGNAGANSASVKVDSNCKSEEELSANLLPAAGSVAASVSGT